MAQCEAEGRKLPAMDLYAGIFNSKLYASNRGDRQVHQMAPRHVDNWPRYGYNASPVSTTQHSQSSPKETRIENNDSGRAKLDIPGQSDVDNLKTSRQVHVGSHVGNRNPKKSESAAKGELKESGKLSSDLPRSNLGNGTQNHVKQDVEGSYLNREITGESPVTRNGKFQRADDLVYSFEGSPSPQRASDVYPTDDLAMVVSEWSLSSSNDVARRGTNVDTALSDNDVMPVLEKDLQEPKGFSSGRRTVKSGEINGSSPITERNHKVEVFAHHNEIDEGFKSSKGMLSRKSGEINSGWINEGPRFDVPTYTKSQRSGEQEINVNGKSSPNAYLSKDRGNAFMTSVRVRGQASSDSASSHGGSSNGGSPTAAEATRDGRTSSFGNILMSKGSPNSVSSRSLGNHGKSSPSPNKNSLNGSPVSHLRQGNILGRKSGEMMLNRKSGEMMFDDQLRGSATHRMGADGMGNIYSTGSGSNRGLYDTMFNDQLRGSATHRMSVDGSLAKGNQQMNGNGSPLHNGSLLVGGANGNVLSYGGIGNGNGKMDQKQGDMTNNPRAPVDSSFLKLVQSSNDPEDLKNAGNEYYRRGFFTEAVILYDRAIALSPTNASYRGNRAAALTGLGRLAEAVQDCEEALQLDPLYVRVHQRVAALYLRLGLFEKAYEHLHAGGQEIDLLELQRVKTVERHLSRCIEARKLKDWHNVIRESDAAVVAGADSAPQVFGYKCEALLKLSRSDEADNICNVAQRVDTSLVNLGIMPATPFLLNIRSQVDLALGRFDEAVAASESAAKISPSDFETAALLRKARTVSHARSGGNELFKAGKYFEATALYTEGLESDPTNSVLFCNRAACRMKLEQWEKAVEDCDAALRLQPHYTKALMRRAQCMTKLERWEDALQDYEVLRREMPCDIEVARAFFDVQVAIRKSQGEEVYNMKFGGEVEEVVSDEHYRDAISSPGLSIVQFITRWSDRCRQLSPFVDDLCKRHPCVNFWKVDVEDHPYIAKSECVSFIPTFKIYKNGQKLKEIQGPTEQSLEYALQHYSL